MIVDLDKLGSKQMFITNQVESIKKHSDGYWHVQFHSTPRTFRYNTHRLLYLTEPEQIDLRERGLYIDNKRIDQVAELFRFSNSKMQFYHVIYKNGSSQSFEGKKVYVTRTPIDQGEDTASVWHYLRKLTDETGLEVEGENILSKQYDLVDTMRDNTPLNQFLGNKTKLATYTAPQQIYYPFGCNASQKAAVEAALTHQVSIIQGPPGTGKTQTILNIIANLLLKNKTILVVSNNNSAVANVAEKLEKEGLGFIVAQLGSLTNREAFIDKQDTRYPDIKAWDEPNISSIKESAKRALDKVSQGFEDQTREAQLEAEINALETETRYNSFLQKPLSGFEDWLSSKSSAQILKLLGSCNRLLEKEQRPNLWFRLRWAYTMGLPLFSMLKRDLAQNIRVLEDAFYQARKLEIKKELSAIEGRLSKLDIKQSIKELTDSSLKILKHHIAHQYRGDKRPLFTLRDLKQRSEELLREYPIVLSTTYSAKSCISPDLVFDYVIMDEASQIDLKTGALALSSALNAVIVGDDKQLPNVVGAEETLAINAIQTSYQVDSKYNALTHSFLKSCTAVFCDSPQTLLREHYRCHPKIIEFCNQHFYSGQLISMTKDKGEEDVLQVIRTAPGNHARLRFNQREVDVITQEVLTEDTDLNELGIITPYRDQASAINKALGEDIASTVHKYQGRERDAIILSMVDNAPTTFSDDANLMNVALSRAKKNLCIVATGNELPEESNLAQLIAYIQYHNFEVKESKLRSVFDILYKQYTRERLSYEAQHAKKSEHLSENIIYNTLSQALEELQANHLDIISHYPLYRLIEDWTLLDDQERAFAESPLAHIDILLYNSLTKRPLLAIEVDGWHFHQKHSVQQARDLVKDQILSKYNLKPHRLSTISIVTVETLKNLVENSLKRAING